MLLLGLVIIQQRTAKAVSIRSDAVWLADDPNEPGNPAPEFSGAAGSQMWLDTDDPNEPGPSGPEIALNVPSASRLSDDPNEPGPSGPERA
jgi:hypothetical protein